MPQRKETMLVAEDDKQIRNYIGFKLRQEGFPFKTCDTARCALSVLGSEPIDLMLLDLGLPDMDGMEIIHQVREWSDMPIIVVSARDQDQKKAEALDAGADDYLTKPFSATELMARIRVALRHAARIHNPRNEQVITVKDLSIDFTKRLVFLKGREIHLTPLEYKLLCLFFRNIGKVLTTQYIIKEIYGIEYGTDTQALRRLMVGLRHKIEDVPMKPQYIKTETGIGYRLVDEAGEQTSISAPAPEKSSSSMDLDAARQEDFPGRNCDNT